MAIFPRTSNLERGYDNFNVAVKSKYERNYTAADSIDDSLIDQELLNAAADEDIQQELSRRSRRPSEQIYPSGRSISELGHYNSSALPGPRRLEPLRPNEDS